MKKGRILYFGLLLVVFVVSTAYFSYAFFTSKNEEHGKLNIVAGTLNYKIESEDLISNQITVEANSLKEITINVTSLNDINSKYELYYVMTSGLNVDIGYNSSTNDSTVGQIGANETKKITVSIRNNTSSSQTIEFGVEGGLTNNELVLTKGESISEFGVYAEHILNGATPVLTDNLVPITISDDGTVTKADINKKWYSYEDKNSANAVVLKEYEVSIVKDSSGNGNDGTVYGNLTEGYGYGVFDGTDNYIDTGLVFMDILTYFERTADQCSNIAMLLLSKDSEEITKNHHSYLEKLHQSSDQSYLAEQENRRAQYLVPLENVEY